MEIKPMRKIASVNLALLIFLSGYSLGDGSDYAWADPSPSPNVSEATSSSESASGTQFSDPSTPSVPQTQSDESPPASAPIWLWIILGVLGVWNVALSALFLQNLKDLKKIRVSFREINEKFKKLDRIDNELNQRISRKFDDLNGQISAYRSTVESIKLQPQARSAQAVNSYEFESRAKPASYDNKELPITQKHDYTARQSSYQQPAPSVIEPWDSIAQNYNLSPHALEKYVIERVSESTESVDSRRGNSNAGVFLKSANNYSYWILAGEDRNYWLTPKSDLKITPIGFDTFQALFECPEYQPGSKIQIVKPAKVAQNSASGGWDLLEKGQVLFVH